MPGKHVTDQQVRLYMELRRTHTREAAAARAGFGATTGSRVLKLSSSRRRPGRPAGVRARSQAVLAVITATEVVAGAA